MSESVTSTRLAPEFWLRCLAGVAGALVGAVGPLVALTVGGAGNRSCAAAEVVAPRIVEPPAAVQETLGGAAGFIVRASGSAPLRYQWLKDGAPLPGETRELLGRAPLTTADAGDYAVTVTNAAGADTSAAARLTLLPAPPAIVDPTFRADLALNAAPAALLPLPDGGVLVANARPGEVLRLRADGSLDPSWRAPRFALADGSPGGVACLGREADGRILVGGTFATVNGSERPRLVRLEREGAVDAGFAADPELTALGVFALVVPGDGRVVLATGGPVPVRLLADGRRDPEFQPQALAPARTSTNQLRDWGVRGLTGAPDGGLYVAAEVNLSVTSVQFGQVRESRVLRLDARGARVETFNPYSWPGSLVAMRGLADGSVVVVTVNTAAGMPGPISARVVRLQADGAMFPGHAAPTILPPRVAGIAEDGRVVFVSDRLPGPVRLTALGAVDSTFTGGIGSPSLVEALPDGRTLVAGRFSNFNGRPANCLARLQAVADEAPHAPRALAMVADRTTVAYDEPVTLRAAATGSASVVFEWRGVTDEFGQTRRTAEPEVTFTFSGIGQPRTVQLVARNARGDAEFPPLQFTVLPDPPVITVLTGQVSAQTGRNFTLLATLNLRAGALDYDWSHDGRRLPRSGAGPGLPTFFREGATKADAGLYTLTVTNSLGATVTSAPMRVRIDEVSRFANVSTRARVEGGDGAVIAGFTLAGPIARRVLVRGIGPGLAPFGITDSLPDPRLRLHLADGRPREGSESDDWHESSLPAFAATGAFSLAPGSKDAAFIATLDPGTYTVVLTGGAGESGVALVEVYEYDRESNRMLNLSTRARVTPSAPAVAGFAIDGLVAKRVLLRVVGPGLAGFGVAGVVPDPRLTVRGGGGVVVAENRDWGSGQAEAVAGAARGVGAFPLLPDSRDAAVVVSLPPGLYTLDAESTDGRGGVALLEIYELPEPE
jgi:hypothetical protein